MERNGDMATQIQEIVPHHHTEETTEWVIQVEQRFENGNYKARQSSKDVCIFKMSRSIRDIKRKTYDAYVVPLSPFFHYQDKKDQPSAVDDHKLNAVEVTLPRLNVTGIGNLITIVMEYDNEIRDCYQDRAVECSEKKLAWIMTMGACFIIQFICYSEEKDFNLFFGMINIYDIMGDILKLENQIPLRVLKVILELDRDNNAVSEFALNLSLFPVFQGTPFSIKLEQNERVERIKGYIIGGHASHLLDLYRLLITDFLLGSLSNSISASGSASASSKRGPNFFTEITRKLSCMCRFTASAADKKNDNNHQSSIEKLLLPTAEKLTRAGIKFEQSADGKIRFETTSWGSATLFLPRIEVADNTETRLKNLMALEECRWCVRPHGIRIISYYIDLLDRLIDSKEDVSLLRKANIIHSWFGSDEDVADMFNAMCEGVLDEFYSPYDEVLKRVKEHHDKRLHRLIAEFKERYCSKPWLTASLVVGLLILVMTAVQTGFSVKGK